MKMSKVFELPVDGADVVIRPSAMAVSYDDGVTPYDMAARAINNHDKLIDLLKQAVGRVVISTADQDELQWFIDAMDVLEGEL